MIPLTIQIIINDYMVLNIIIDNDTTMYTANVTYNVNNNIIIIIISKTNYSTQTKLQMLYVAYYIITYNTALFIMRTIII